MMSDDEGVSVNNLISAVIEVAPPRVYARRWIVLLAFTVVNLTNGMLWISFASVADICGIYYKTNDLFVNILALIFPIIAALCGVFVSSLLLRINLRVNMTMCALANLLAAGLRVFSASPVNFLNPIERQVLVMAGQTIAGIAQPFIMFSSTTLAAEWFAEDQRAIANTIASLANPCGILLANIMSPLIAKTSDDMFKLNLVYCGPALFSFLLVVFGLTRPRPPTPPTLTRNALVQPQGGAFTSLRDSLGLCLRNRNFLLLVWGFSVGMGLFTALSTFMEQILCPVGYSNDFAGDCGAVLIGSGLLAGGIVGAIVDKTGAFNEAVKLCFAFATIAGLAFFVVMEIRHLQAVILISVIIYGGFAFASYPVALELGAEITYPASETVSSGLLIQGGQVMSVIMILLIQFAAVDMDSAPYSVCAKGTQAQSFRIPGYLLSGLTAVTNIPLLLMFHGEYRRRRAETQMSALEDDPASSE